MKLPIPQDEFMRQVFRILEVEDMKNRKTGENIELAGNALILTSPNGTRYQVIVNNVGVLSTVPV